MTEEEFLYQYRKSASMGGDRILRRPPMWECSCGCLRFRKVNANGTDAKVKLKLLKDIRPAPLTKISWQTLQCSEVISGVHFLKDFCASIRNFIGGRSSSYENELIKAREKALAEMSQTSAQVRQETDKNRQEPTRSRQQQTMNGKSWNY